MTEYSKPLAAIVTPIPGLVVYELPVHGDSRGWFKENWQREKMLALGLPDFDPVQNNISFNDAVGTTRGIHAEPWDKFISVATGRIFGAWVDLREGPTFGEVFTTEIDPSRAIFVPRGVGNSFQTLEPDTAYTYLVNDHWSSSAQYSFLNLADETVAVEWPIALSGAEISEKDKGHPRLADVVPIPPKRILVLGADGQVGLALRSIWGERSHIDFATRSDVDLTKAEFTTARRWREYSTVVNAAAYTAVDKAETEEGRAQAWAVNAAGVAALSRVCAEFGLTLVHLSTDYVFDGAAPGAYTEAAGMAPLSVYGASKAAGDVAAATCPRHYILRTSWVIGDGHNFVRTMANLAARGMDPTVIDDQRGRLTFASTIAQVIDHVTTASVPYGTYNVTNSGEPATWCEVAKAVYELTGHDPQRVTPVTTAEYFSKVDGPVAPRPRNSVLALDRLWALGIEPDDWRIALGDYLRIG